MGNSWRISEPVGSEEESAGAFFNDLEWLTTALEDRITQIDCLLGLCYGDFFSLRGLHMKNSTKFTAEQKTKFLDLGFIGGAGDNGDWAAKVNEPLLKPLPLVTRAQPGTTAERLCITAVQLTKMTVINKKPLSYVGAVSFRLRDDLGRDKWYTPSFDKNAVDAVKKSRDRPSDGEQTLIMPPSDGKWIIRGFYGSEGAVMDRVGVIWSRDPITKANADAAGTSSDVPTPAAVAPKGSDDSKPAAVT